MSVAPGELWVGFCAGMIILLLLDLWIFGRHGKKPSVKSALLESSMWIGVALAFNIWFAHQFGAELGIEFFTGYVVEKSLSVDNLFVILLIFSSFRIADQYQHRVLFYGVLGAIVLRALFIVVGAGLLAKFHFVFYVFGLILIYTAVKLVRETDEKLDPTHHWAIRFIKMLIPVTDTVRGQNFFIREQGSIRATPLFLALVVIECTDVIFAVDSIPAVFAVTQDAFVAFSSNIMAILGLRALYFVLADWIAKLRYLKPGLSTILGFIGIKMILVDVYHIPSWISLLVITAVLTTAALSSWYIDRVERSKLGS